MKTIRPARDDKWDPGYPSMGDVALSRRGFLTAALAAGGGLLLPSGAGAGGANGYHRVLIPLHHGLSGCAELVERLIVQSKDARLAAFLKETRERGDLVKALRRALGGYSCDDLADQKRLARMEAHMARTLATHYQGRTRRRTALPIVTLVVGRRRNPALDGLSRTPSVPYRP